MESAQDQRHWLGIDIGGTKILGAVVGDDLRILDTLKVATSRNEGPESVMGRVVHVCRELVKQRGEVNGIGVGFAGLVDWRQGRVLSSIILPGWDGYSLSETLSASMGNLPVFLDNDATAAGYGEYLALGSPPNLNMILLTVGTGIGGAIIIDGTLYRGTGGISAEFGNTTIEWQGRRCWCGNLGCLNTLASGSAISRLAEELSSASGESVLKNCPNPIPVERIAEAAGAGDTAAIRAIEEGAKALGAGVANFINIFNPDRIVITGGVSVLGEDYLQMVKDEAARRAFSESVKDVCIELSVLGTKAGVLGAAGLIRDHLGNR